MNERLKRKLADLPLTSGVYFHKNKSGEVIYIGKAAKLKNRVRQYFQKTANRDIKTAVMIKEIVDVDWTETESEIDALFLESELIKRYKPRYNIELRDDKSLTYVRIDTKNTYPFISFTRQPMDDGAEYFGPFSNSYALKKALKYLRKIFPYSTHQIMPKRVCLQYHIGLCPGIEESKISAEDYKKTINNLRMYLKGQRQKLIKITERNMKQSAKINNFEQAVKYRDQLGALKALKQQIIFGDREFMDISKDQGLSNLKFLLNLPKNPKRIEAYDISHMSGADTSASMVVFTNGLPDKTQYRKFKMVSSGNDDFAHIREVMVRRFSNRNQKWLRPDLILIDGGKGQVSSALSVLKELGITIPVVGLAKRYETLIIPEKVKNFTNLNQKLVFREFILSQQDHETKLLQRIRDESHRFALNYHSVLRSKRQTSSSLDNIPGFGPASRKKLIKHFGSLSLALRAKDEELSKIIGFKKAKILSNHYAQQHKSN